MAGHGRRIAVTAGATSGPRQGHDRPDRSGQPRSPPACYLPSSARTLPTARRSRRSPEALSHGGSQGFKSPHLHPQHPWSPAWRVTSAGRGSLVLGVLTVLILGLVAPAWAQAGRGCWSPGRSGRSSTDSIGWTDRRCVQVRRDRPEDRQCRDQRRVLPGAPGPAGRCRCRWP
jgi:hypothetical protein